MVRLRAFCLICARIAPSFVHMTKTLENGDATPLGFSDLSDEESFVVTVFRHWRDSGPTRNAAEQRLCAYLRHDRLYGGLQPLFELFETFPSCHASVGKQHSALLSPVEEAILNEIGSEQQSRKPGAAEFCKVVGAVNGTIRSTSDIPRSGHDCLLETIHHKTTIVLQTLYPLN